MRFRRHVALIAGALTVVLVAGSAVVPAPANAAGNGSPEIGITSKTIHIAVLADVNTPAAPGLFKGSVVGLDAFAKYINANGGIAGRKLVVDFIDTQLSADQAQQGLIQACQNDFALVGTSALFLNNLTPMLQCQDKAGKATGLPDFPNVESDFAHACSPVSFTFTGNILQCATKNDHPQTYTVNTGAEQDLAKTLHLTKGSWIEGNDIKGTLDATLPAAKAEQGGPYPLKGEGFLVSGLAPQSTYTPYVERLQQAGTQYVNNLAGLGSMVLARKEAAVQGVTGVKAWSCTEVCYDQKYIQQAGTVANGTYVTVPYVPSVEANLNKETALMVKYVGKNNVSGFSTASWIEGRLFQAAVNAAVAKNGTNGLTRANLLTAVRNIHSFNANGMIGNVNVGVQQENPCFMELQVKNNQFVQVYPAKKGTLDCKPSNLVTTKYNNES
jgi:ABC-type branched-subunit amino acid transport system substrate-binding protein